MRNAEHLRNLLSCTAAQNQRWLRIHLLFAQRVRLFNESRTRIQRALMNRAQRVVREEALSDLSTDRSGCKITRICEQAIDHELGSRHDDSAQMLPIRG